MHRIGCSVQATVDRGQQDGVALLLALATTVVLSLLALSVLASREASVAASEHGEASARARRAATSGAEWALAAVMAGGPAASSTTLAVGDGDQAVVVVDRSGSPQMVVTGSSGGAVVRLGADFEVARPPLPPHAWVSLSSTSVLQQDLTVHGSAHLNGALPIALFLPGKLRMHGDLHLTTTSTLGGSSIVHVSGATTRGVTAIAAPTVDVAEFPTSSTGGVAVTSHSGDTELKNTTLTGIVRVSLAAGQTLKLSNLTLNGTLVVDGPNVLLNRATLQITAATIQGGTALTGNLAVLANQITVEVSRATITGVTMVHSVADAQDLTHRGLLITAAGVVSKSDNFVLERPADFVADTPLGLRWGTPRWRLRWRTDP